MIEEPSIIQSSYCEELSREDAVKVEAELCPSCAANSLKDGKCEKCNYVMTLQDYGFEVHKLRNKTFILTRKDDADPLCTIPNLTSPNSKKAIQRWTEAPTAAVEKSFAILCTEGESKSEITELPKNQDDEEIFSEETAIIAWERLRDPSFFYRIGLVFEEGFMVEKINKPRFVLGEDRNKRLIGPLIIGAAKLGMTSLIRIIGEPGTAKDTMVRMWLRLLGIKYLERSYLSAAALRYSQNIQDTDLLYIPDTPKMQGESGRQMLFMRSDDGGLISEYATRDNETGEMITKTVTLPIKGVVTTSNEIIAGAALASGMWTLTTDADLKLTEDVKREKLRLRAGNRELLPEEELKTWRCAFKLLLTEELPDKNIPIEYAESLCKIIGNKRSESRRDPDKLCDLIGLIAWIRRFQKPAKERGKADFADLYIALQIGKDAIKETMSELNEKEQKISDAIRAKSNGKGVTVREIAENTKIPYKTVYKVLTESLLEKGYLTLDKEGNRNFYRILTNENPDAANGNTEVSFPFQSGRSDLTSEEVTAFTRGVISHFSTSHEKTCSDFSVVDPLTGETIKFISTNNSENTIVNEENVKENSNKLEENNSTPTEEEWRSNQTTPNQASNDETDSKPFLSLQNGKEKVINLFNQVKPAEPCSCGKHAVEYELILNGGTTTRKCRACFEEFRLKTVNAIWKQSQGDPP